MTHWTHITKTQRAMLKFLVEGSGQIYTGSRSWSSNDERRVAHCNLVSLYFVHARGWIERTESNHTGWWYRLTPRGRAVLAAGQWSLEDQRAMTPALPSR